MSGSSFRSVFMVASCAGAALGCYLVSLRVASERAALEDVETEIVVAQRDIRLLQTEIGTRGRLAQLERWNVKVLALSAPAADQFLEGGFALARLTRPAPQDQLEAPVVLAAAPADAPKPTVRGAPQRQADNGDEGVSARDLLNVASLRTAPPPSSRATANLTARPATTVTAHLKPKAATGTKLAAIDTAGAKPARTVKPARPAADPLAPLPTPAKPTTSTAKESGKAR
jgi:hypothetical protein